MIATVVSSDSTSTYNYLCNQCLRRGVLDTTLCDKVAAGLWFSPGTPVSSTNKTDYHDITELLLKVALNTITILLTNIYLNPMFEIFVITSVFTFV